MPHIKIEVPSFGDFDDEPVVQDVTEEQNQERRMLCNRFSLMSYDSVGSQMSLGTENIQSLSLH